MNIDKKSILGVIFLIGGIVNIYAGFSDEIKHLII